MGLVAPAAAALSLDAPAIGLRARESGGEPGGEAFFGLLAQHLQSKGASDQAIAVITAKAGVVAPVDDTAPDTAEADDDTAAGVAVTPPVAPTSQVPVVPQPVAADELAMPAGSALPPAEPASPAIDAIVAGFESNEAAAPADAAGPGLSELTATVVPADELVAPSAPPAEPTEASDPLASGQAASPGARSGIEGPRSLDPQPPPGDDTVATQPSVVRAVGNAPELEANAETPAQAAVADETSSSNDTSAPSPDLAPANTSAPATTLLTSQAPSLESVPAPTVEAPAAAAPLEQVAEVVIERLEDGGGEARLVLDPPDLGEVVIRLHTRADHVRVEVIVERPEALLMLRDGSPSLQALLAQRGLDLGDATFLLSQQRGEQHGEAGEQTAEAESGFAGLLGFDEPGDPSTTHNLQRLRSAYNPDGALLYRV